jgi:hypothetical protein
LNLLRVCVTYVIAVSPTLTTLSNLLEQVDLFIFLRRIFVAFVGRIFASISLRRVFVAGIFTDGIFAVHILTAGIFSVRIFSVRRIFAAGTFTSQRPGRFYGGGLGLAFRSVLHELYPDIEVRGLGALIYLPAEAVREMDIVGAAIDGCSIRWLPYLDEGLDDTNHVYELFSESGTAAR